MFLRGVGEEAIRSAGNVQPARVPGIIRGAVKAALRVRHGEVHQLAADVPDPDIATGDVFDRARVPYMSSWI
jgi:hypothetical protein